MLNLAILRLYKFQSILVLFSLLFYWVFVYDLVRSDSVKLIVLYSGLFLLFYKLIQLGKHNLKLLTWLAFVFRAVFILAIPNLSQDFYRFIWDGRILLEGINPYLHTVEAFITSNEFPVAQTKELYAGMGTLNASHYTNYPPLKQMCFAIAGILAGKHILGSVIVMRLLIIAADFGTLFFGKKLLKKLNIPIHHIFWYILNPFIIIELTGNLHFEGVMVFFLIWSLYLLHIDKWKWAAVIFALSVSVKLIPLLFLPLFLQKLGWKKSLGFYTIIGLVTVILFAPFYSLTFINNYAETIGLWFNNFEFNASLYYIAREIGYLFRGYNEIAIIGTYTALIMFLFVIALALFGKNKTTIQLITTMLIAISFYYFTATTVHPWYVATLILLSVFTNYKFPLIWSYVIILSYLAYSNNNNQENYWIIGLEYIVVYSVFIWEVFIKKPKSLSIDNVIKNN